jgi:hypothetical protein
VLNRILFAFILLIGIAPVSSRGQSGTAASDSTIDTRLKRARETSKRRAAVW